RDFPRSNLYLHIFLETSFPDRTLMWGKNSFSISLSLIYEIFLNNPNAVATDEIRSGSCIFR
ncbi:MAG: hypothetical protein AAGE99_01450, partial [Chlamydiota bacterium]